MLIDAGAARIDLSDLPHPQLAELGTRQRLSEVVPTVRDLPADVNVKAELVLTQPFRMEPDATTNVAGVCEDWAAHAPLPPAPEQSTIPAIFRAVELKIQVLTRRAGLDAPWNPLAEFDVDLEQSMFGRLVSLESDKRAITVHWNGFPRVRVAGRYSTPVETAGDPKHATESPQPIDAERFAELFSAGWQAWTDSVASTQINTPDVRIGGAPLRIEQLHESLTPRGTSSSAGDESPETDSHVWWVATYLSPATRLLNTGTETINYQSHGPFDVWGPVRELPAGEEHSYRMPYPLSVRVIKPVRSRTMTVESGLVRDLATNR
jgi:hypothetical protein